MQRRCPRFLRACQNEIESLDFSPPGSKHRHTLYPIVEQLSRSRERFMLADAYRFFEFWKTSFNDHRLSHRLRRRGNRR